MTLTRGRTGRGLLSLTLALVPFAGAGAQSAPARTPVRSDTVAASCPAKPAPATPTDAQRRAARDLVARAQEAAIVSDDATARDLYQRAARLDPTDATIAYALARSYEGARDARAVTEYCRFLALSPNAPEAPDVRRRVSALSFELAPRITAPARVAPPPAPPSAGSALALGILIPGGGQYYTHRPVAGLFVTALTAGAAYYALQSRTVNTTVTRTATDPFGNPYQYQQVVTTTERPNAAAGLGAAAGIWFIAALEAYGHAHGASRAAHAANRVAIVPTERGAGIGVRLPLSP